MPTAVQFSIALDNTAGTLAKLCGLLKRSKINVEAISSATTRIAVGSAW